MVNVREDTEKFSTTRNVSQLQKTKRVMKCGSKRAEWTWVYYYDYITE